MVIGKGEESRGWRGRFNIECRRAMRQISSLIYLYSTGRAILSLCWPLGHLGHWDFESLDFKITVMLLEWEKMKNLRICALREFPEERNWCSEKRIWAIKVSPGYKNLMVTECTEEECVSGTSKQAAFNFEVEPLFHRASNASRTQSNIQHLSWVKSRVFVIQ